MLIVTVLPAAPLITTAPSVAVTLIVDTSGAIASVAMSSLEPGSTLKIKASSPPVITSLNVEALASDITRQPFCIFNQEALEGAITSAAFNGSDSNKNERFGSSISSTAASVST